MAFSESHLRELIEEATVDCYGEYEEYWGFYTALEELGYPFKASVLGDRVKVTGISDEGSERRGVYVTLEKKGKVYHLPASELNVSESDGETAAWIEAYKLWSSV